MLALVSELPGLCLAPPLCAAPRLAPREKVCARRVLLKRPKVCLFVCLFVSWSVNLAVVFADFLMSWAFFGARVGLRRYGAHFVVILRQAVNIVVRWIWLPPAELEACLGPVGARHGCAHHGASNAAES